MKRPPSNDSSLDRDFIEELRSVAFFCQLANPEEFARFKELLYKRSGLYPGITSSSYTDYVGYRKVRRSVRLRGCRKCGCAECVKINESIKKEQILKRKRNANLKTIFSKILSRFREEDDLQVVLSFYLDKSVDSKKREKFIKDNFDISVVKGSKMGENNKRSLIISLKGRYFKVTRFLDNGNNYGSKDLSAFESLKLDYHYDLKNIVEVKRE